MLNDMTPHEREAFAKAKALLSEHFPHYCLVVITEDNALKYNYPNYYIGKMLMRESVNEMNKDSIDLEWDDAECTEEEDEE